MAGNEQYTIPRLPNIVAGYGVSTPFGVLLPPGGKVAAYLRSTGAQDGDDPAIGSNLVTTLANALARVRSGLGDTILVLPGHSESVVDATMLTNLLAGTKIIGVGRGSAMPVFRWTAAASAWVINKGDVIMTGLRLRMEGFNGVTKALQVSGADCAIANCDIEVASGAALKATIAIELVTGADRFEFVGNIVRGTGTHNVTNCLLITNPVDQVRIIDNEMVASATIANGLINVQGIATNLKILRNYLYNTMTASTAALNIANVAVDGIIADNYAGILANGAAVSTGIVLGAAALVKCFQNFACDEPIKSGILNPAAAT